MWKIKFINKQMGDTHEYQVDEKLYDKILKIIQEEYNSISMDGGMFD